MKMSDLLAINRFTCRSRVAAPMRTAKRELPQTPARVHSEFATPHGKPLGLPRYCGNGCAIFYPKDLHQRLHQGSTQFQRDLPSMNKKTPYPRLERFRTNPLTKSYAPRKASASSCSTIHVRRLCAYDSLVNLGVAKLSAATLHHRSRGVSRKTYLSVNAGKKHSAEVSPICRQFTVYKSE